MQRHKILVWVLVPLLAAIVGVSTMPIMARKVAYAIETGKALASRSALKGEEFTTAENVSKAFQEVAQAVEPSVVSIKSVKTIKPMMPRRRGESSPNLERREFPGNNDELFRRFFEDMQPMRPGESFEQRGEGSGIILSADGYILTNNHVVSNADEIEVKLMDGRNYTAKVIGTDSKTDLAVLKIDASGLLPVDFGNSDDIRVGQWVLAIGSPFSLELSVTQGIISAKGRSHVGITDYEDFLQTDAAINPGNSGGPLVNLHGQVVGINTAIATRTGNFAGVGFAIPINMVKTIKDSLISKGHVDRGWLGIAIQELTPDMAKSFAYSGKGVLVGGVNKDGPADKAGMKDGDIIIKYGDKNIESVYQLRQLVADTAPNEKVSIAVFRDGKLQELNARTGEQETNTVAFKEHGSAVKLGLTVQNLTTEMAQKLGVEEKKGVLIGEVDPGSLAARAGLRSGEVITSINGKDVTDVSMFEAEVKSHDLKQGLRLQVIDEGMSHFILLKEK